MVGPTEPAFILDVVLLVIAGLASLAPCLGSCSPQSGPGPRGLPSWLWN